SDASTAILSTRALLVSGAGNLFVCSIGPWANRHPVSKPRRPGVAKLHAQVLEWGAAVFAQRLSGRWLAHRVLDLCQWLGCRDGWGGTNRGRTILRFDRNPFHGTE